MRAGTVVAAALVLAAAGCGGMGKKLGFTDEADKDWSANNSKAGGMLDLDAPQAVRLVKFDPALAPPAPRVKVALKNEGDFYDIFSVDVEFGYPAPAESFAEYNPEIVSIDLPEFKKGDTVEKDVAPPQGVTGVPFFARIVTTKGKEVRMTTGREDFGGGRRQGSLLLGGRVEVVAVGGSLDAEKPTLSFTLENVDSSGKAVGDLRYTVQFNKDGKFLDLGRRLSALRPVGEPLGEKGKSVVLEVKGLETTPVSLAGSKPVLRLTQ